MVSFLFSILDKKIYWDKVYDLIEEKEDNFEIVFVLKQTCPDLEDVKNLSEEKKNVSYYTFDDNASENFMINEGIKKVNGECLVLCRDYFDYAPIMADFLVQMGKQGAQVAMFKKEKKENKFLSFVSKYYRKFTQNVFGFELYQGDIGLIYFGNIALSVLKEIKNCCILTKVNRWKGFDVCYALISDLEKPKPERKHGKKIYQSLIVSSLLLTALLVSFSLLLYFNLIGFILVLLFATAILLNITWLCYTFLKLHLHLKLGDLQE